MMHTNRNVGMRLAFMVLCLGFVAVDLQAQEENPPQTQEQTASESAQPVSGGVVYAPIRDEDNDLRDPFKSPFELEEERRATRQASGIPDLEERLPYTMGELDLRGIYLRASKGYLAIFRIGDVYKWYPIGTKFQDSDLVNITDGSVTFNQYVPGDELKIREVVKVLRQSEE